MRSPWERLARRSFLQTVCAGFAGVLTGPAFVSTAAKVGVELSAEHRQAVNRRRRVVVQYDPQDSYDIDFDASDDEAVEASLNGAFLPLVSWDPSWKDPQIFSPRPQPASGGSGIYRLNPRQRLLRLDFAVDSHRCRVGENVVGLRLATPAGQDSAGKAVLEKLEVHVQYADS